RWKKREQGRIKGEGKGEEAAAAMAAIQKVLDKRCLAAVRLAKDKAGKKTMKVESGPAGADLVEQGWRVFLVKVYNPDGVDKLTLQAASPNAAPLTRRSTSKPDPKVVSVEELKKRFLDVMMFDSQPMVRQLSGLELEYRIVQVYCRDAGRKEATLGFRLMKDPEERGKP